MNRLGTHTWLGLLALSLWLPSLASADGKTPDFRIQAAPQRELSTLQMREVALAVDAAPDTPDSVSSASPARAASSAANSQLHYKPIPTDYRDIKERVIFKTNIGYGLDSTRLSGKVGQGGFAPGDVRDRQGREFSEQRQYVLGDAIIGSRGILLPSLNSYFLSRFRFNAGGDIFSASNHVYDANNSQQLLIRAAYAEVDGLGEEGGVLDSLYVRAGRQFRYGSDRFASNFDGLTVAYDNETAELSAFVGQRVSLFFDDNPGVVAGAGMKLRGQELVGYPVDLHLDFLRFDGGEDSPARSIVEANSRTKISESTRLYLRGRFIDDGSDSENSSGIGRLGAQLRQSIGEKLLMLVDLEKNFAREVAFDYAGSSSIDVVNAGQEIGLAIGRPQSATLVGARANYQVTSTVEVYGLFRKRFIDNQEQADAFSRPFQEFGLAMAALFDKKLTATGQYKFRSHDLDSSSNIPGSRFDDTGGSGTKTMHEVSADARYRFGAKKAHAAIGAYLRIYDVETPYASLDGDGRGGGRFDLGYWPTTLFRIRASGELAQPSQVLEADLDVLLSLRLMLEASF